jgi:hypothetical protein
MTVTSYKSIILLPAKKVALYQWLDGLFPAIGCEPQPGCGAGRRFKPDRSLSVFLPSLRFPHRLETSFNTIVDRIHLRVVPIVGLDRFGRLIDMAMQTCF